MHAERAQHRQQLVAQGSHFVPRQAGNYSPEWGSLDLATLVVFSPEQSNLCAISFPYPLSVRRCANIAKVCLKHISEQEVPGVVRDAHSNLAEY
jgi:hypothetical protein